MSDYRRYWVPGGTYFFTLVTYRRRPLFTDPINVQRLRRAAADIRHEQPFDFLAAVVLRDHMHFLWTLPSGDSDYAKRIGRMKVFFTHSMCQVELTRSPSQEKHHESGLWQRRFWEHTIDDENEMSNLIDYIHYNPVKHGLATCPHAWQASSFRRWVQRGLYDLHWGCCCQGRNGTMTFPSLTNQTGEP